MWARSTGSNSTSPASRVDKVIPPDAPRRALGPPRAARFSYIGAVRRAAADVVDMGEAAKLPGFALVLVRPGARSHARWRAEIDAGGSRRWFEASGARIAVEHAERAAARRLAVDRLDLVLPTDLSR
jgi:hypothetical protein